MAMDEEELAETLAGSLGRQYTTEEALRYARGILDNYDPNAVGPEEGILDSMREREESTRGILRRARERIEAEKDPGHGDQPPNLGRQGVSRAEKLLAISAGLGTPTQTGAIGETAGNVSRNLQPLAQRQTEFANAQDMSRTEFENARGRERTAFENARGRDLTDMDLAITGTGSASEAAELDLSKLQREQSGRFALEALKTVGKTVSSSGANGGLSAAMRLRQMRIDDLMNLHGRDLADATAIEDGHMRVERNDELGTAVLINEAVFPPKHSEIPLSELEGIQQFFPGATLEEFPTEGISAPAGSEDERQEEQVIMDGDVAAAMSEGYSLWDMADSTGPWAAARRGLSLAGSILHLGTPVAEETIGSATGLRMRARDLARSLVGGERQAVQLILMAIDDAAVDPSIVDSPDHMRSRMVSLDREMWSKYQNAIKESNDMGNKASDRADFTHNAVLLATFMRDLNVPPDRRQRRYIPGVSSPGSVSEEADSEAPEGVPERIWNVMTPAEKAYWTPQTQEEE